MGLERIWVRLRPSRGASAAVTLLDDVPQHRLRRAGLHLPPRRSERDAS
jgi:hypothetical protein